MQFFGNGAIKFDATVTIAQISKLNGKFEQLKNSNALSQISQAKQMAPEVGVVLNKAHSCMGKLLETVAQLEAENEKLKNQVPGQFTDRVVTIQGREGFKWQVML